MRNIFIGMLVTIFVSGYAKADIEGVEFLTPKGASNTLVISDAKFINPSNAVDVVISAGLDRKLKVELFREDVLISSKFSTLVDIDSRISFLGKDFYGKKVSLETGDDGFYTVVATLLSNTDESVTTWTSSFMIDTKGAVSSNDYSYANFNGTYSGSVGNFGTQNFVSFSLANIIDNDGGSGVKKVEFISQPVEGDYPILTAPATYDQVSKTAVITTLSTSLFPINKSQYHVGFRVYDNANNIVDITRISNIDNSIYPVTISHVYNPNTNRWDEYFDGITVYENPAKVRFKRLKSDFSSFNGTPFGWMDQIYGTTVKNKLIVEGENVFDEVEIATPTGNNYWDFRSQSGLFYRIVETKFVATIAEGVDKAPKSQSGNVAVKTDTDGWVEVHSQRFNKPVVLEQLEAKVEERSYEQLLTVPQLGGSCVVPSNESSCIMTLTKNNNISSGILWNNYYVYSSSSQNGVADGRFYSRIANTIIYFDMNPSQITKITQTPQTLIANVFDQDRKTTWQKAIWLTDTFYLESTENGVTKRFDADRVEETDSNNYEAEWDLSKLQSGYLTVDVVVEDSFGNVTRQRLLDNYLNDKTPPSLSILVTKNESDDSIIGLESVNIKVVDLSETEFTSVILSGGPTSDYVSLAVRKVSDEIFALEYPRIFPSLDLNEQYTLTVSAKDSFGNSSSAAESFKYTPPNLLKLNKVETLALNNAIFNHDENPVSSIKTDTLRTVEGHLASGPQIANVTLRSDSAFPVIISNTMIRPGETKEVQIAVNDLGQINEPIYPAISNINGSASFLIDIPQIKSLYGASNETK